MKIGQNVKIKTLCLEYSDYKDVKGTIHDIAPESILIALPVNSLCEEDERELHREGDQVFVKVKKEAVCS